MDDDECTVYLILCGLDKTVYHRIVNFIFSFKHRDTLSYPLRAMFLRVWSSDTHMYSATASELLWMM